LLPRWRRSTVQPLPRLRRLSTMRVLLVALESVLLAALET
jgi:hypothetical protein